MTAGADMYAPTVLERTVALEPITRDDFINEPSRDDRQRTTSPVTAYPGPAHQRDPASRRRPPAA